MPHRARNLLAALALAVSAGLAWAGPVDCGKRPIKLAFYEYGFFHNHQGKGIDKDIVEELNKRTGCRFDLQVMTRARIWADLAGGDLDMSVSGIQTPERDRFAWFAPYLIMKNYAIVSNRIAREIASAEDFIARPQLSFGVVRAFKHGADQDRWLERLRKDGRVQESPDVETIFKKLGDGRVDAMFSQPPVYRKQLRDLDMTQNVSIQDWTPGEKGVPHGLILAKARFSEAEAVRWREQINALRKDGTLKRIYRRYLPAAEANALVDY